MFLKSKTSLPETKNAEASKDDAALKAAGDDTNTDTVTTAEDKDEATLPEATMIGANIVVTGNVTCDGDLTIAGKVNGNVASFMITISEDAEIAGDLAGDSITVRGKVLGNIRGADVKLVDGCDVTGNIMHEKLLVETGAMFEGQVKRIAKPGAENAPAPAQTLEGAQPAPPPRKQIAPGAPAAPKSPAKKRMPKDTPAIMFKDTAMIVGGQSGTKN